MTKAKGQTFNMQAELTRTEEALEHSAKLNKTLMEKNTLLKIERDAIQKVLHDKSEEYGALCGLRERQLELAKDAFETHIEKYCPKSLNQSACTWMHDYDGIKKALKDIEEMK